MTIPIATASPWPARAAYFSATIFAGASGAINVTYGWQKGTDLPSSLVWAAVAGAVAVAFTLSWPATIRSLESRRWSAAIVCLVALVLFGSYSVTAALGSASGGRADATSTETAVADTRAKAQAAYDSARAELGTLKPARPTAELEAIIARNREAGGRCAIQNGTGQLVCPPHPLAPELARAKRRAELEGKVEREAAKPATTGPARVANADAKALAGYLAALGHDVNADRINRLLVLLAVLLVECGAGLSLTVGIALSGAAASRPQAPASGASADTRQTQTTLADAANAASVPPVGKRPASVLAACRASAVEEWLRLQGGNALVGMRRLGADLGRSASSAHDEVRRLAASGVLQATPGPRGTLLELMPTARLS